MLLGINHITIAVSDLERSILFYRDILGFTAHVKWDNGAYLSVGELWFCLSCDDPCSKDDYSHIAFDIAPDQFEDFKARVLSKGVSQWKNNKSEGLSLYILDPDGHKLEIHVGDLQSRLSSLKAHPYKGLVWL